MIKEKTLSLLIEGGLLALEDSMRQDPRYLLYPDTRTSEIYRGLNYLIKTAKEKNIDVSQIKANHINLLTKYRVAI